jgi:hypothetical protein
MQPVQRLIRQALILGAQWITAERSRFDEVFSDYGIAERNALWNLYQTDKRPVPLLGYPRTEANHPGWWILLAGSTSLLQFAGGGYELDKAAGVRSVRRVRQPTVQVIATGRTPDEAQAWGYFASWAIDASRDWLVKRPGVIGIELGEEADLVPMVLQEQSPSLVYQFGAHWHFQTDEAKAAPVEWGAEEPISDVLVMRAEYADENGTQGGLTHQP